MSELYEKDLYDALGIKKHADKDEIKSAYRKLASKYHPDRCKDKDAEERFKQIQEAYDVLGNEKTKLEYDQYQDARATGYTKFDFEDFSNHFGFAFKQPVVKMYNIYITLEEAYTGTTIMTSVGNITLPAGVRSGTKIKKHDALIEVQIHKHDRFFRQLDDLYVVASISYFEAIIGIDATVKSIDGKTLKFKIPPNTQHDGLIKLSGKGMPRPDTSSKKFGDLYVICKHFMPSDLTKEDRDVIVRTLKRNSIQL